uniref:Cysteine-rich venom protein latisemin-like n=1 Tax=Crassostrea virginica TaxID=6565 RepID=A0A8B8A8I0_CRAVI|nr:cysteine-rich venom protein latisemin-like [Crassostrea virginica]
MERHSSVILFICMVGVLSTTGGEPRHKRALTCPPKFLVLQDHSACLPRSASATNSGVLDADKQLIVDSHNTYRSGVSPTAAMMYKMYWDDEIAMIAQRYADACKGLVHDSGRQRSIPGRFSVGQNLAAGDYDIAWPDVVRLWYDEVKDFTLNGSNSLLLVGHFTQVVSANSVLVGCGFAICGTTRNYVCNYGPAGNMDIDNPYLSGAPCGDCPSTCNGTLCDCGGKVCLNGGTMDPATCLCTCKQPTTYIGETCQLNCSSHQDKSDCERYYLPSHCDVYVNVPEECPTMCKACPCAGIDQDGSTACLLQGKGGVTSGPRPLCPLLHSALLLWIVLFS